MSWPDILRRNLGWKLLSLLLATLVWFTVRTGSHSGFRPSDLATRQVKLDNLPITVLTTASDTTGFMVTPRAISVEVRGDPATVDRLQPGDIAVYVNLVDVAEARSLRKRVQVHVPPELKLVRIDPEFVEVERDTGQPKP